MSTDNVLFSKRILNSMDPLMDLVEKTYNDSFPVEERRDFSLIRNYVESKSFFELYVFTLNDQYVGFITGWNLNGFVYVEHFAIDPSSRNGGIGAKAMNTFISLHSTPIVLEVELPVESLAKRRVGFYERLGFVLDNHVYFQPPYHPGDEPLELRLMTYGELNLNVLFEDVSNQIRQKAYGIA